jgi:hypothetical protein
MGAGPPSCHKRGKKILEPRKSSIPSHAAAHETPEQVQSENYLQLCQKLAPKLASFSGFCPILVESS